VTIFQPTGENNAGFSTPIYVVPMSDAEAKCKANKQNKIAKGIQSQLAHRYESRCE
jgi:hypothetical protein